MQRQAEQNRSLRQAWRRQAALTPKRRLANNTPTDDSLHWATAFALTIACYVLAGFAALPLAVPPGYATPLYPAAGVALAFVLIFGRRMLPAIAIGSLCVNVSLALMRHLLSLSMLVVPLAICVGATLQAWVGAMLVKRWVQQPLMLSEPRDITMCLAAGVVSCLVNPCIANAALLFTHTVPLSELP